MLQKDGVQEHLKHYNCAFKGTLMSALLDDLSFLSLYETFETSNICQRALLC